MLAEELVKRGHQVTILTSWHDKKTQKEEIVNGVLIKRVPVWFYIGKGPIYPYFLVSSIKEILKNDIINCHLPQPESLWLAIWSKFFNKKIFLTQHTDLSFWPGVKNKLIDGGVFACQFLAAKLADKIIPYTLDYAKNSYFLKNFLKKTEEVYPPIRVSFKENKKIAKDIDKVIADKKYIIGFCGRIAKQKGLEVLINTIDKLKKEIGDNYIILLAGPKKIIGERYYEYLYSKYKKEIDEKFIFLGNIERDSLAEFYKKIGVLVLPSNDTLESFGWVQIEAMYCGTPCVATNLPGMRIPIVKTGFGEIFKKNDSNDLSKKLAIVLKRGKSFYQIKDSKKLNNFDYNRSIDQYEKLFKESLCQK